MKFNPLILSALILSACSTNNFTQPQQNLLPQSWTEVAIHAQSNPEAKIEILAWQDFFQDETLKNLLAEALQNNLDLKKAAAAVNRAQALYGIQENQQLPTISAPMGFSRSGNTEKSANSSYSLSLVTTNFELDFFGKTEALKDAALQQYLATKEALDSAQLSIISAVSKIYYQLRIIEAQLQLSEKVLKSREETYRLSKLQFDAGIINKIALRGIESALQVAKNNLLTAQKQKQQALNALSVLLGKNHNLSNIKAIKNLKVEAKSLQLPPIPAEALLHRPDIRQAEYALQAAAANVAVARATMYPSITFGANLGVSSNDLDKLFSNGLNWGISTNLLAAIFNRDSLDRNVKANQAQQESALADYQKTVQKAFYDLADVLYARESLLQQLVVQEKNNQAVNERLRLEELRFKNGISSALELLDAQRESYNSEQALLNLKLAVLHNYIDIYSNIGGGKISGLTAPKID